MEAIIKVIPKSNVHDRDIAYMTSRLRRTSRSNLRSGKWDRHQTAITFAMTTEGGVYAMQKTWKTKIKPPLVNLLIVGTRMLDGYSHLKWTQPTYFKIDTNKQSILSGPADSPTNLKMTSPS